MAILPQTQSNSDSDLILLPETGEKPDSDLAFSHQRHSKSDSDLIILPDTNNKPDSDLALLSITHSNPDSDLVLLPEISKKSDSDLAFLHNSHSRSDSDLILFPETTDAPPDIGDVGDLSDETEFVTDCTDTERTAGVESLTPGGIRQMLTNHPWRKPLQTSDGNNVESERIESFPLSLSNPVPSLETLSGCREESSDAVENSKPLETQSNIPINAKAQRGEAGTHVTAAQGNAKVDRDEYGCTSKPKLTDEECQGVILGESVEGTGGMRTIYGKIIRKQIRYSSVNFIGMARIHYQHAKTIVEVA